MILHLLVLLMIVFVDGSMMCQQGSYGSGTYLLNKGSTSWSVKLEVGVLCSFVTCARVHPVANVTWKLCSKFLGCSEYTSESFSLAVESVEAPSEFWGKMDVATLNMDVVLNANNTPPVVYFQHEMGPSVSDDIIGNCNLPSAPTNMKKGTAAMTTKMRKGTATLMQAPYPTMIQSAPPSNISIRLQEWQFKGGSSAFNDSFGDAFPSFPVRGVSHFALCLLPLFTRDVVASLDLCVQVGNSSTAPQCTTDKGLLFSSAPALWVWYPPPSLPSSDWYDLSFRLYNMSRTQPWDTRPVAGVAMTGSYNDMKLYCDVFDGHRR